ncbi:MAG: hypothetical protein WBG01_04895 [Bacteroidota bacterium]
MGAKRKIGGKKRAGKAAKRSGVLVDAAENIEEGAELVGERISDVAGRTAEVAGDVLDALKHGFSQAYEAGARAVDEVTKAAGEYAEKYKQNMEMKRLSVERDKLTARLGHVAYRAFKSKKWSLDLLSGEKEARAMYEEIERLDREVIKIGREIERAKSGTPESS